MEAVTTDWHWQVEEDYFHSCVRAGTGYTTGKNEKLAWTHIKAYNDAVSGRRKVPIKNIIGERGLCTYQMSHKFHLWVQES